MATDYKPPYLKGERLDCAIPATAKARLDGFRDRTGFNPGEIVGALLRGWPDDEAEAMIVDMLRRDREICALYRATQRGE